MRLKYKNIVLTAVLVLVLGSLAAPALAQNQNGNNIVDLTFPCPTGFGPCAQLSTATSTGAFINSFYQIALAVSGLLALLMIVYGGIRYTISAGNAGAQEDAKDIITSALWGVTLLLASYLILNAINPRITSNLNLPGTDVPEPPVPSTQVLTVANTECIPNITSSTAASTTFNDLPPASRMTYLGNGQYDNLDSPSSTNCVNRTFITSSTLTLSSDDYYDLGVGNLWNAFVAGVNGTAVINPGSIIWQYPYFTSSTNPAGTARCLIYAYRENNSSSTTMIGLNPNLQLCYPHNQNIMAQ